MGSMKVHQTMLFTATWPKAVRQVADLLLSHNKVKVGADSPFISQLVGWSVGQPVSQSVGQPVSQPVSQSASQSASRSVGQSASLSVRVSQPVKFDSLLHRTSEMALLMVWSALALMVSTSVDLFNSVIS